MFFWFSFTGLCVWCNTLSPPTRKSKK
jgi:hypothetical protein